MVTEQVAHKYSTISCPFWTGTRSGKHAAAFMGGLRIVQFHVVEPRRLGVFHQPDEFTRIPLLRSDGANPSSFAVQAIVQIDEKSVAVRVGDDIVEDAFTAAPL